MANRLPIILFATFVAFAFLLPAITPVAMAEDDVNGQADFKTPSQTDTETAKKEAESINNDDAGNGDLSEDEEKKLEGAMEQFEFQAEVNRMMDILINSLYQNKDIFLRELISNGSDALDKIRLQSVKDDSVLGEQRELEIRISYDEEAKTITIRDTGCGMTKKELIENLGTVAKSGTSAFIEQMQAANDISLIGQFGVGFYSVYLVADKVRVISKHNDDSQYIWESTADSTFSIAEDPRGDTLGRGSMIILTLKEDAKEFLNQYRLETLLKKYSEFINFPIYLRESHEEEVDAEEQTSDEKEEEETTKEGEDDLETKDEDKKEKKDEKKKVKKTVYDWKLINEQKAIWTRDKSEITDEEYRSFYKSLTKDYQDPRTWIHFKAEGDVEFKGILYLPQEAPRDMFDNYYSKSTSVRLYVRKVLVSDKFEDLLPRYLNFIRGVLDSDDLPLNVSRETLQQDKVLKVISKKVVRKVLEMLKKLAAEEEEEKEDSEKKEEAAEEKKEGEEEEKDKKEETKKEKNEYMEFWKQFGKNIKLGVIEDASNRNKLTKLLRYQTNKSKGEYISIDQYIKRMKEWQDTVYYIAGDSIEAVEKSIFLEKFNKKDVEVLYMTDPMDEYAVQHMNEYDGKKLQSITKEGVKFGDEGKTEEKRLKMYEENFSTLTRWMKEQLGNKVEKIEVSTNLENSPAVMVTSSTGYSANMERIVKSQAFANQQEIKYNLAKRIVQINPRHPIIVRLNDLVTQDESSTEAKDIAWYLHDSCVMNAGFIVDEPKEISERMYRLVQKTLELESLELEPEIEVAEDEPEEEDTGEENNEESGEENKEEEEKKEEAAEEEEKKEDEL